MHTLKKIPRYSRVSPLIILALSTVYYPIGVLHMKYRCVLLSWKLSTSETESPCIYQNFFSQSYLSSHPSLEPQLHMHMGQPMPAASCMYLSVGICLSQEPSSTTREIPFQTSLPPLAMYSCTHVPKTQLHMYIMYNMDHGHPFGSCEMYITSSTFNTPLIEKPSVPFLHYVHEI